MTFRLAPYSLRGNEPPKKGDRLIVGWFGDNTDHIVWQAANVNP